jgi:hypothetical protein
LIVVGSQLALFAVPPVWLSPLWWIAGGFIVGVLMLIGLIALMRVVMPKLAAIGWTTGKEALSQPLFYVLMAIGAFGIILFPFLPYYTLGEDVKRTAG